MSDLRPKSIILITVFALLGLYIIYQARVIILGPQISIMNLKDGEVVHEQLVQVQGRARNISQITLNDRPISIDEKGYWNEKLLVSTGTSIMTLYAKDRFGREKVKRLRIILN